MICLVLPQMQWGREVWGEQQLRQKSLIRALRVPWSPLGALGMCSVCGWARAILQVSGMTQDVFGEGLSDGIIRTKQQQGGWTVGG